MSIILFLIILLVLVLVHEAGHFFTAKKFGIRVDEFGFGFPPKLFGYKWGETEYTFNLLPLGGFVKIFGEDPNAENTNGPDKDRSFVNKPKYAQALVLLAGVTANFFLAWLLFSVGFMSGLPASSSSSISGQALEDVSLIVVSVLPDSPAEHAGLEPGYKIVSLSSDRIEVIKDVNPEILKSFVSSHGNEEIEIGYERGLEKETNFVKLTPVAGGEDVAPMIGIAMDEVGIVKLPFFQALYEGMGFTLSVTRDTAIGLYGLIVGAIKGEGDLSGVTGPVGMVGIVGNAYQFGLVYLLSFTALISINLAIINILPLPALDGGRLLFLLIESIKGSPINYKVANMINMASFTLLIIFMLFVTYHDIVKLF